MEWLEPWESIEDQVHGAGDLYRSELVAEVSPGHVLYGVTVQPLAKGCGDDVLFKMLDGSGRVVLVHLTWTSRPENFPFPVSVIYPSLALWISQVMLPEHQKWME